jgi:hypothetical protein
MPFGQINLLPPRTGANFRSIINFRGKHFGQQARARAEASPTGPAILFGRLNLRFECVQQVTHQLDHPMRVLPVDGRDQGKHGIRHLKPAAGRGRVRHAEAELLADPMNR